MKRVEDGKDRRIDFTGDEREVTRVKVEVYCNDEVVHTMEGESLVGAVINGQEFSICAGPKIEPMATMQVMTALSQHVAKLITQLLKEEEDELPDNVIPLTKKLIH